MSTIQNIDTSANILRALLWRHNSALNLQGLIQNKQDFYDVDTETFWDDWYTNVFDLRTANDFGLLVWSAILGLTITISNDPQPLNTGWGFGEFRVNWFGSNFNNPTQDVPLTTEDARVLLRLRYYQLTSNATIPVINAMIADVFESFVAGSPGHVVDNLNMTMEYVFNFNMSAALEELLIVFDILQRPAGVAITITDIP